ncbi:hypothetical protein [Desertimonas flava]|uniref:hypothetical protein n=1 Tax=Desertimonas flava TaxID=2064846 RepID=UPI0013C4C081|nr:hypothetical protein [Desertimonas flava]
MKHWVVMEAPIGARMVWAWGLVGDEPGFEQTYFTETDGHTPANIDDAPSKLGAVLFVVPAAAGGLELPPVDD